MKTVEEKHEAKDAVRILRESLGESQKVFASRFGMSQRGIANYEVGHCCPKIGTARQMVALARELGLGYDLDVFMSRDDL